MKKITLLLLLFVISNLSFSQTTKIAKLTFETDPTATDPEITDISYTTDLTIDATSTLIGGEYSDGSGDYFTRTLNGSEAGSQISATYNYTKPVDLGDYFFAANDMDDGNTYTLPITMSLDAIDISNYENLELRVYLASIEGETNGAPPSPRGWDNRSPGSGNGDDRVHFDCSIDSGTIQNLIWIESSLPSGNTNTSNNGEARIDTDFDGQGEGTQIVTTFTQFTASISGTGDTLDVTILFDLNNAFEDIAIDNIEIWGDPVTCSATDVTWTAGAWDNAGVGPTINDPVVIDDDYSTGIDGNFSACSLTINAGVSLVIDDGDYIEIENGVVNNGDILVENNANFVQNGDLDTFTNAGAGTSTVAKNTSILSEWWYYTYWSSPVSGLTIANSPLADSTRRYWHNAANYLDEDTEINNTGTFIEDVPDDIDDDGDDWQWAGNSMTMTPGVGFIAAHPKLSYTGPDTYDYDFIGAFNNGVITASIEYDPLNTSAHWNLIGNPYPGALDFDAFMTENSSVVDGAAYLWEHKTTFSGTSSGNEVFNFSSSDYIVINSGSGSVNNSPNTLLEYIPSGQSFFIAGLTTGNVTFNNSMRVTNGETNSQFFKSSNGKLSKASQDNKLWINLSSDNGVFNQALVAYVDGATNNYDGMKYDAPRNLGSVQSSIIYTLIEGMNDKKYAIQGKNKNSLNEEEVIPLGFSTSIESATIYNLSIQHIQGDFLTSNVVYLKDNLLNTIHNLSDSDYAFTSDVGEFNSRFEIVFNANALSTNLQELANNALQVIYLNDQKINFKVTDGLTINHINIYDLFGRKLYDFEENSNSITYSFSNLNDATYIANIELSNNIIVTKKIIKN